ncbi:MAG: TonB-dependent receptor [Flavobacteriaceae bacterium]|nr:TonB-dependent receptor [Flavobacteriaceae bacterium]
MKKNNKFFILFFTFSCLFAYAQEGVIAGTVFDGDFNEPMAFANIIVKGTTTGTTSDFDGKYQLELDAGTYTLEFSFVGYETKEVTNVEVKPNQTTDLDITLYTNSLEQIFITTSIKRNTENAVLDMQRKSVTLLDGLSAQSMKKTGASDVANAVKNVPGVSVQGGKYVFVRGLGDRYTKSILNGVDIPGLDPDRNTIPMDIFPTNLIDNVIVVKSAAAEYPADFTGGIVNIVTKDFPTRAEYGVSVGAGYNSEMHFNDNFLTYDGGDQDFWGYDDGTRDLPMNRYQPIPGTFENKLLLNSLTNRFNKQLKAEEDKSGMNYSIGLTAGNQYDIGDNKIGYLASFSYKNNTKFYEDRIDNTYQREPDTSINELGGLRLTTGSEGIQEVLVSALGGITFKSDLSKYKLTVMHLQNGESSAGFFNQQLSQGGTAGSAFEDVVKDALLYTERSITNISLNGSHNLGETDWKFDWTFSPSFSKVEDKDHRITPLQVTQEGNYIISPSTSTYPVRLWRSLLEENWVGKVDLSNKYMLFNRPAQFKIGGGYVYKYRDFSIDQFFFSNTDILVPNGDTNQLLLEQNLWSPESGEGTFLNATEANRTFDPVNAYKGEQNVGAFYVSNEFNISEKIKTILGLRTEFYKLYYTGQNQNQDIFNNELIIDEFDVFPSANLIYAATDNSNIRVSYSRTTARPSFKEASIAQIFDPISNRTFIGNGFGNDFFEAVRPTYVNNIDLRYELFRENGQMVALSGFYKDFTDPIETVFFPSSAEQFTVSNLGNAKVIGAEVEFRQRVINNLRFIGNFSYINSKLSMGDVEYDLRTLAARDGETIDRERPLQGQSPFLINAGFDYGNDDLGLQAGLFYNVQGKTLEVVGTGITPNVYTKPFNSLNFTFNKTFSKNKNSAIDLKVTNILGDKRESDYESFNSEDQLFSFRNPGTEISLGYSYKF